MTAIRRTQTSQSPRLEPALYGSTRRDAERKRTSRPQRNLRDNTPLRCRDTTRYGGPVPVQYSIDAQGHVNADRKTQNAKRKTQNANGLLNRNTTKENMKGHRHHDTTLPPQKQLKIKAVFNGFQAGK